ncbi:hypothetical protein IFM89_024550 [Coptis chinensis]|uniref:Uncharacterized protein n=1 Tax=Coptis chinensis TaxID=261450 RepID=A0A835LSQ0_9MAGN|nr:hypothetical protein IFM89_024550 [Coptis chinensis]
MLSNVRDDFGKFADFCSKLFDDRVKKWDSVSEPSILATHGYLNGINAPGRRSPPNGNWQSAWTRPDRVILLRDNIIAFLALRPFLAEDIPEIPLQAMAYNNIPISFKNLLDEASRILGMHLPTYGSNFVAGRYESWVELQPTKRSHWPIQLGFVEGRQLAAKEPLISANLHVVCGVEKSRHQWRGAWHGDCSSSDHAGLIVVFSPARMPCSSTISKKMNFNTSGLRTLAPSYKELEESKYHALSDEFQKAKTTLGLCISSLCISCDPSLRSDVPPVIRPPATGQTTAAPAQAPQPTQQPPAPISGPNANPLDLFP